MRGRRAVSLKIPTLALGIAALVASCGSPPRAYAQPAAGHFSAANYTLTVGGVAVVVRGAAVASSFFDEAQAVPLLGRFFATSEGPASGGEVVVLSDDLWTARFGKAPTIIGQAVDLDGRKTVVVGIAPPGFQIPDGAQLWTPRGS